MLRLTQIFLLISLVLLIITGCSSSSDNPLIPHENETAGVIDSIPIIGASIYENGSFNAIGVFGTFEISIDAKNGSAELVAKRNMVIGESYLVNGISYFTITPCPDCLKLKSLGLDLPYVKAVFSISHPFEKGDPFKPPSAVNRLDLDVFDLALVIVPTDSTPAQYSLTSANIYAEICGNVDGYTTELTEVTSDSAACPYFLVLDDSETGISKFNRFEMGSKDVEFDTWFKGGHFDLYLTMGYGASAKKAQRLEPTYYNPEFNRKAAWKVNVNPSAEWPPNDNTTTIDVIIEVYDWQIDATVNPNLDDPTDIYAASNVASVSAEIPGMNNTLQAVTIPTGTHTGLPDDPLIYTIPIANENLIPGGTYTGLVKVSDERVPPSAPAPGETDALVDVPDGINISYVGMPEFATYQSFTAVVGEEQGWAITWGGSDYDWGAGVAVSSEGDIYVSGGFEGTTDFDPGDGVEERTAVGTWGDYFLSKFDSQGNFQWVRTWASDTGFDDIDVWGDYVYVCGYFRGDVDFDPSGGEDWHSAGASLDTFVSKFDSSGNFIWASTWGGSNQNMAKSIAVNPDGDVYTSGYFGGTSDFDPGSGEDWHTAHGTGVDSFLSKLDSSGNLIWARTWGSMDHGDDGWGLATDSYGDAYVTGDFDSIVDFDPDPVGEDLHTSNGSCDVFLTKFYSNGDFVWARTWGGTGIDMGASAIVYQPDDYVYVSGQFESTVDFDPEGTGDIHVSNGGRDAFISKFTSSGVFLWAKTWGGSDYECVWYVNVSPDDEPCGCGYYRSSDVDFDPGAGVDEHSTNGGFDVFLSKFDSSGDFLWAKTWGGTGGDNSWGVAVSLESEIYITGNFEGTVDFDPSDGNVDEHTSNGNDDAFLSKFLPDGSW